ncbi:MAG: hypothetical protein GX958_10370 [Desulfitobacterium sp.]|nr:hypothetical protein [Desulfitobacterium sp.]
MRGLTKRIEIYIGVMIFLTCLMATGIFFNWQQIISLQKEKENISFPASFTRGKIGDYRFPTLEELPFIVEECVGIFAQEEILTSSYNLQYIGEEQGDSLYPKYAVMKFKVLGSWEGIKKALKEIESIPRQNIHIKEVNLYEEGGEFVFWIHFLEPKDLTTHSMSREVNSMGST